jgi:hypothetical protein
MPEFFQTNLWTMVMVASVFGCLIPIVAIITEHQRKIRQAELDNELKRDLLAQGRTPEEIQTILEMSSERGPWWARRAS